jgi:ankyrin repeat protein
MNVNAADREGKTPLHYAAMEGHLDVVKWLVAEVGAATTRTVVPERDGEEEEDYKWSLKVGSSSITPGMTPLHYAALGGHLGVVKWLVEEGKADLRTSDKRGHISLHHAAWGGSLKTVQYLVRDKADGNAKNFEGDTPLHHAAAEGHLDVMQWLVAECKADVSAAGRMGMVPLHHAAAGGHLDVVRWLVTEGRVNVNAVNAYGAIPLHLAVSRTGAGVVKWLVTEGQANVNAVDGTGWSLLHYAVSRGSLEILRWFIKTYKLDVNARDKNGRTPLYHAARVGSLEVVRCLVKEYNADIRIKDSNGVSALMVAEEYWAKWKQERWEKVADYLRQKEAERTLTCPERVLAGEKAPVESDAVVSSSTDPSTVSTPAASCSSSSLFPQLPVSKRKSPEGSTLPLRQSSEPVSMISEGPSEGDGTSHIGRSPERPSSSSFFLSTERSGSSASMREGDERAPKGDESGNKRLKR